jgi:RNA polymerase sigma-70 factor (ECF subfamily)
MPATPTLSPPAPRTRRFHDPGHRAARGPSLARRDAIAPTGRLSPCPDAGVAPPSDEALLARYRDLRRPEDFAELYRRYAPELGRYLARYLGDATLAEDALQDAFLQVHLKCGLYRDGWPARPWLYAVAIHRAVDALRRSRRLPAIRLDDPRPEAGSVELGSLLGLLSGDDPGPLETLQDRERQRWVRESVAGLPEPLRQVLVLAYDRELSYHEIAALLGIPLGTVKSRLHGAIARLREMAARYDRAGRP